MNTAKWCWWAILASYLFLWISMLLHTSTPHVDPCHLFSPTCAAASLKLPWKWLTRQFSLSDELCKIEEGFTFTLRPWRQLLFKCISLDLETKPLSLVFKTRGYSFWLWLEIRATVFCYAIPFNSISFYFKSIMKHGS